LIYNNKKEGEIMGHDYKKSYFEMFNKITDIIEDLKAIQAEMEQKIISDENNEEEKEEESTD